MAALLPPGVFALTGWLAWGGLIDGAMIGVTVWLLVRLGPIRLILIRDHRRGMVASRGDSWADALAAFQASEDAWHGRPRLDRWRAPLLGTSGPWPYLVLARYNQALCLVHLDRPDQARSCIDALLHDYPAMSPARELRGALAPRTTMDSPHPNTLAQGEETWYSP
ncbi:MAG: hypothetical protein GXP62_21230 [Oligoflexia bacterium]|nr:hypothetical protein [Oligoflexia bacterium]